MSSESSAPVTCIGRFTIGPVELNGAVYLCLEDLGIQLVQKDAPAGMFRYVLKRGPVDLGALTIWGGTGKENGELRFTPPRRHLLEATCQDLTMGEAFSAAFNMPGADARRRRRKLRTLEWIAHFNVEQEARHREAVEQHEMIEALLQCLKQRDIVPIARVERRGPSIKVQERAKLYKSIKEKHPGMSQARVAIEANERDKWEIHTEQMVINAYKAMRKAYGAIEWSWERSDRIR